MNNDEIINKLKATLPLKRFLHSIGVADEALNLAKKYHLDEQKAYRAGLLHDCAKYIEANKAIEILLEDKEIVDEYERKNSGLLHAPLGAIIAQKEYMVKDSEILDAIRSHTTGKENMSDLEKIIYLADLIEPGRNYLGINEIKKATYTNLNLGMLYGLEFSIKHVLSKKAVVHPKAIEAWNYICINNEEDLYIERNR